MQSWQLADKTLASRFLLGTAQYPSLQIMQDAIHASGTQVITVSLKRQLYSKKTEHHFWDVLQSLSCHILPNTAGCKNAQDAVTIAQMAREIFNTNWIKLELIGDDYTLQPDPFELLIAANQLVDKGFIVLPYCTDDLILCQKLLACGCAALMPWAAPIGSGKGLLNPYALQVLRQRLPKAILIIDAGIGKPSHAVQAMELGFDGVLINTAVSAAQDPVLMAQAFKSAIIAGRTGFEAGPMLEKNMAGESTPLIDTLFWES